MEKKNYVTPNTLVKELDADAIMISVGSQESSATIGGGRSDYGGPDAGGTLSPSSKSNNIWDNE